MNTKMFIWPIKPNEASLEEWRDFKKDNATEGYDVLRGVFEIYLPFWECKQNIVVEKELEPDRFSKILLEFIYYYKKASHTDICQFLGIDEAHFCIIMQLIFLEKKNLIRCIEPDSYEITYEGIEFLENKKRLRTIETEEFEYMAKEKYSFFENDMTKDFFDKSRPIDEPLLSNKKVAGFSGYDMLQTHDPKLKIQDKIHIKHNNKPTYRKIETKRNDFSEFYNAMNPNKIFYDFADNTLESHRRSICFFGFWYEKKEKPDDIMVEIWQFEKSVKEFQKNELERELSKKVTEYARNYVRIGDPQENQEKAVEKTTDQHIKYCSECGYKLKITAKFCTQCGTKQ